jgi:hypothetical protein
LPQRNWVCATIFLTAVAGTVDIGLLLKHRIPVDTAVNAGAQYTVNNAGVVSSGSSSLNTEISNLVNNLNVRAGRPTPLT